MCPLNIKDYQFDDKIRCFIPNFKSLIVVYERFFMEESSNIQMIWKSTFFFVILPGMTFMPNYVFFGGNLLHHTLLKVKIPQI